MAEALLPRYVPVIVLVVFDVTLDVVIVKLADVAPDGTVTAAGTVAATFVLLSATAAPFDGAAESSVTVPVEFVPPTTLAGDTPIELTIGCGVAEVSLELPLVPAELVAVTT